MTHKKKRGPKRKSGVPAKHGAYVLLRRGQIPARFRSVNPYLLAVRNGLVNDLSGPAGESELTTAQRVIIDRAVTTLGVLKLVENHIKDAGLLEKPGGASFIVGSMADKYLAWDRALCRHLDMLGIERRSVDDTVTVEQLHALAGGGPVRDGELAGVDDKAGDGDGISHFNPVITHPDERTGTDPDDGAGLPDSPRGDELEAISELGNNDVESGTANEHR